MPQRGVGDLPAGAARLGLLEPGAATSGAQPGPPVALPASWENDLQRAPCDGAVALRLLQGFQGLRGLFEERAAESRAGPAPALHGHAEALCAPPKRLRRAHGALHRQQRRGDPTLPGLSRSGRADGLPQEVHAPLCHLRKSLQDDSRSRSDVILRPFQLSDAT